MNLFVLDKNPIISASYLCNTHLNKMLIESLQILSDCARNHQQDSEGWILYNKYNLNHPIVLSMNNPFTKNWLIHYIRGIILERSRRKMNHHLCEDLFTRSHWNDSSTTSIENFPYHECKFTVCRIDTGEIIPNTPIEEAVVEYRKLYQWKYENFKIPMKWSPSIYPEWLKTN